MSFQWFVALAALTVCQSTDARVFNFKNEKVATYFKGTGGLSNVKKAGFEHSGPDDVYSFSDQTAYNYTGEFGMLFSIPNVANIRLGVELSRPSEATNIQAKLESGAHSYRLASTIVGYGGVLNFDFILSQGDQSRLVLSTGVGYMTTTLRNDYTETDASYSPIENYIEEGSAVNFMGQGSFGFEFLLSDTTTMVLDAGYRYFLVNGLKHTRNAVTHIGTVAAGDPMKDRGGADRSLDMSGIWAGLSLRFYISL